MKILAVRIKNLASLEGSTEIDFTQHPLDAAGIFAITGPTGAGKSTILDAICLALYAKTPRYKLAESGVDILDVQGSTIKQDDVRGILRDGTADGYAAVDFTGVDNQQYRATWTIRRARNKTDGNLQAYEMQLKNLTTNTDVPGRKTELLNETERLIGLNFEQFTRAVLLAQGDFTAFLKAGKDEKSALLEKLTGTRIYSEISKRIFEQHKEEAQTLRDLNMQRQGIITLTAEELLTLEEEKATTAVMLQTAEQQLGAINKEMAWQEQLKRLQADEMAARQQYETATRQQEESLPREQQLQLVTKVQTIKPTIDNLQQAKTSFDEKTIALQQTKTEAASLQEKNEGVAQVIEQATTELGYAINAEEKARPLLEEAKKLDVQLNEKATQIQQAKGEADQIKKKLTAQEQQWTELKQKAVNLEEKMQQLRQWKETHLSQQPIAEQEALIRSKLTDARAIQANAADCSARIETAKAEHQNYLHQQRQMAAAQTAIESSLQQTQKRLDTLKASISGIAVAEVQQEKTQVDASLQDIVAAAAHWKLLYRAITDKAEWQQAVTQHKRELEENKQTLITIATQLATCKAERDASLRMLEKAQLAVAENVERLRAQLVADEACPVCGSTSHPYAVHHPQQDVILAELETAYKEIATQYEALLTRHSGLEKNGEQLERLINERETGLTEKIKELDVLEKEWQAFQVYAACTAQPEPERSYWLDQQQQAQQRRQQQLQEQIDYYHAQQTQLDTCKSQLDDQHKQWNDSINDLKDIERKLQAAQDQEGSNEAELQRVNHSLNTIRQELSAYFPAEEWFPNWQADADAFTTDITAFAAQWRTNSSELETVAKEQIALAGTVTSAEAQVANFQAETTQKQQRLQQLQSESDGIAGHRKTIFDGEPVATIEARLKEAIDNARQMLDTQKAEQATIGQHITRTATRKEQLEKEVAALQAQQTRLQENITEWIKHYNQQHNAALTQETLMPLLSVTPGWIEAEQLALRAIADAVTSTQSVWTERHQAVAQHSTQRLSERTEAELAVLLAELTTQLQAHRRIANETDFKLQQDERNKTQIGALLGTIEAQDLVVENWAKLNEIIGSADGKKFRQVAQEYTLDVLLGYANVQLEALSNRYFLQRIPNSLGLQVVDKDMGDEVRTVYSLSGGESFLVSLALALGLASLSSNRMKVESLFIDEGFGSLDPTTLSIAMDALERLHNQGRKVGVISHVQEMTERIPVQIKVSKQQSGRSKVEVIEM